MIKRHLPQVPLLYPPVCVVPAPDVARPRRGPERRRVRLVQPHRMGDALLVVAAVALVPEGVGRAVHALLAEDADGVADLADLAAHAARRVGTFVSYDGAVGID